MISAVILHIIMIKYSFRLSAYQQGDGFVNNSSSNDPGWSKEDCAFSSSDLCMQIQIFFSTTAPTAAGISDLIGEIHLSWQTGRSRTWSPEIFLPRNCKAGRESVKTVKSSIQDITEGE